VKKSGRICGVIADDETLSARFVVLAEGANSELAQRHALVEPPATTAMALGIKEVLALDKSILEERFRLEEHEGAAMLFCGGICGSLPGGAFLYTNQTTLSLGIVCPLSTLTRGDTAANELLRSCGHKFMPDKKRCYSRRASIRLKGLCLSFNQACLCSKTVEFTGCAQELQLPSQTIIAFVVFRQSPGSAT
jgi:flavin-dependent dehydrogenase